MKKLLVIFLLLPLATNAQFTIRQLDSLIRGALAAHQATVLIPPGEYRGTTPGASFIWIQNASGLHIVANGVKMVCEKRVRALEFSNCSNITLEGLTIDYDPLTYTQGDIVAMGSNYVDVKIHQGYPVEAWSRLDVIDPATRYRKRGSIFAWSTTAQLLGGDTVRVTNTDNPNFTTVAQVGDMATMSAGAASGGAAHTLVLSNCQGGMVLRNVTVNAGPGFGIFEAGGEGGTVLDGCSVSPGPKPAGAMQERLLCVSWDAIQHKLTRRGPVVENCTVESAGDDSWSVTWDGDYVISSGGGTNITVAPDNLQVGDSLRSSLSSDVVYITAKSGGMLTLNKNCPWATGAHLYSPSRRCENFILRDNYFHSTGRVLVKAGHGLIENNVFDNTHSGVTVHSEQGGNHVSGMGALVIRNNDIIGTGHFMNAWWSVQAGAVCIVNAADTISPSGTYDSIRIENNRFTDISGVNIVVTSASNVLIKENDFYSTGITTPQPTGGQFGIPQQTVVYLKHSDNVTLDSNRVHRSGLDSLLVVSRVTHLQKLRKGIFDVTGQQFDNITPYCCGNDGGKAFDGNLSSFVDAASANGAYTGMYYPQPITLDSIRFFPRGGFEYRMNGGQFQGSNDDINYTAIYTLPAAPPAGWSAVAANGSYQYLRYLSPNGGYCNVAEIVFVKTDNNGRKPAPAGRKQLRRETEAIRAFPNPAGKTIYLTGLNSKNGRCMVTLAGLNGRVIFNRQLSTTTETAIHPLDLSSVPGGVYVLKVNMPGTTKSIKLVRL
ncbi:T9SS type A sorting domain-containing protein [Chitinophaga sp. GCM10012297]|uniref:T9SS type A sorting domain-containing protein n=1 Tax=Chitinophaga chungangae TaxID=2821488 RepID=A0ABS3YJ76_9BACT|nr:T9SS type A sorting domain-containing protein [Chitinophaga chungangae]MBO9154737.1 T9SS type A sorting domain-containing protein [Chitinophaga chungangae]